MQNEKCQQFAFNSEQKKRNDSTKVNAKTKENKKTIDKERKIPPSLILSK